MQLITHSRLTTLYTCLRKHHFAYEVGLRRIVSSQPLRMGSAVHMALDLLARKCAAVDVADAIRNSYATVPGWADFNDWLVECETCVALVNGYAAYHQPLDIVATEKAFELKLPGRGKRCRRGFRHAGKIDKIAKLDDGRLAVVEHKTTSDSLDADSDYWRRLQLDTQISGYMHAARRMGHAVETCLYDVVKKPGIRPKLVNGTRETPAEYADRLAADIASRPEWYYARREIPRLAVDLDEYADELDRGRELIVLAAQHGLTQKNTAACLHPYKCEYFDVCTAGWKQGDALPAGFEIVTDVHPELQEESA